MCTIIIVSVGLLRFIKIIHLHMINAQIDSSVMLQMCVARELGCITVVNTSTDTIESMCLAYYSRQGVYALGVVAAPTLSVLIPWVRGHPPTPMLRGELEITKRNFACNQIYPLICNRYTFRGGVRLLNILEILEN